MDTSRQQFEEWRSKNKSSTINLFDVWQASRESLEIELPERKNYSGFQQFDKGYERAIDDCENILISNGVKIKDE
ncbi:TPA: hypothetical protein SMP28_001045 [Proteus mirabilis]|uniref:hypothetical protein n=1 Tax=Proteus mirabilis TaxID=584 RepID=UPI001BAFECA0|nr:hypothetical protein [Proteus mirabilis]MBS3874464.1 hypothetical protein [Proteus mirabilis]MCT0234984.1 hypothetical protein [Proteus mirabilis]HEK0413801.1 hypothetical protein [Proteus mirabilis]HEK0608164.1 hypothetical protein [Proteus mirabilis]HEK2812254.1 hypothetical protein [Proteus mirabilis]